MGCFGSRMDSRRKAIEGDWNGLEYSFGVGSVKTLDGFYPLDKLVVKLVGEGKELKEQIGDLDGSKIPEDKATALADKIFEALKKTHEEFKKNESSDDLVFGKYTGKEAFKQVDDAVKLWCEKSGFEHKLETAEAAKAPEGMGEAEAEAAPMEMEGGEEAAAADAEAPKEEAKAKIARDVPDIAAFGDFAAKVEIPKLLTAMVVCFPAFGDAVKSQVVSYDLGGDGADSFKEVAALTGAYVDSSEKADTDSFGCARLSAEDLEELQEVDKNKETQALVFPGIVVAWADEATATGYVEAGKGTLVTFKFKGKAFKPAGDKAVVFHRQFAKVKELKQDGDKWVCELEDFADAAFATVEEYKTKFDELAKAAAAAKEVVDQAMDAAADKKDDAGMEQPPAEDAAAM